MELGRDVLFPAILQTKIRRGPTIDFFAVLGKPKRARPGFQIGPVKRQGGQIEHPRKILPVGPVLFGRFHFVKHKNVRAVEKSVLRLLCPNVRAGNRRSVPVQDLQPRVRLAGFYALGHPAFHVLLFLFEGLEKIIPAFHIRYSFFL